MIKKSLLLFCCCVCLTACTTIPKVATTKLLFNQCGYPDRVIRLRHGRRLLIYKKPDCEAQIKVNASQQIIAEKLMGAHCQSFL